MVPKTPIYLLEDFHNVLKFISILLAQMLILKSHTSEYVYVFTSIFAYLE